MPPMLVPDEATLIDAARGELVDEGGPGFHTIAWLWPTGGPAAPADPLLLRDEQSGGLIALELRPNERLTIQRGVTAAPALTRGDDGWGVSVPSVAPYSDVVGLVETLQRLV